SKEHADHDVAEKSGHQDGDRAQRGTDDKQANGAKGNRRKHQRRVVRWCRHWSTSILANEKQVAWELPERFVRGSPSVSEGEHRAGITQGAAPFVGRKSAPIGRVSDGPVAGNPRGFFGF